MEQSKFERVSNFFSSPNYLQRRISADIRKVVVKELLGDTPKKSILDLGCGDGSISLQLLNDNNHLTLVDFSENMLKQCIKNTPRHLISNVEFLCFSLEDYIPKNKFDVVICIGVLSHMENWRQAVLKVVECMKPGGYCLFQITDWDSLAGKFIYSAVTLGEIIKPNYGYNLHKISSTRLKEIFSTLGIKMVKECRYWHYLPFITKIFSSILLEKFRLWAYRTPWMSIHGSDVIIMFSKN